MFYFKQIKDKVRVAKAREQKLEKFKMIYGIKIHMNKVKLEKLKRAIKKNSGGKAAATTTTATTSDVTATQDTAGKSDEVITIDDDDEDDDAM